MTETPHSEPGLFFPLMAGFYDRASGFAYPLIRFFTGLILMPRGAQKLFGWFGGRGLAATGGRLRREARARARPVLCSPGRRDGVLRRFLPRHRPVHPHRRRRHRHHHGGGHFRGPPRQRLSSGSRAATSIPCCEESWRWPSSVAAAVSCRSTAGSAGSSEVTAGLEQRPVAIFAAGLIAWSPDQPHTAGSAGVPALGQNFFPPRRRIRRLMFV